MTIYNHFLLHQTKSKGSLPGKSPNTPDGQSATSSESQNDYIIRLTFLKAIIYTAEWLILQHVSY